MALLLNPVSFALSAKAPTASLNDPLPRASPALLTIAPPPTAVFREPLTLNSRAAAPTAVLISELLKISVPAPAPVLKLPVVSKTSEFQPNAEFAAPVTLIRALRPSAVLNEPPTEIGSGVCGAGAVCAFGANAKHTRMSGMRRNPRHNGSERAGSRPHA